ncbi:MAG: transcriptional repressor [Chloroflexota bacterium]|nr:transcriptional repressor [Chloroflexota bacterium]
MTPGLVVTSLVNGDYGEGTVAARLRRAGQRVTPQRVLILSAFRSGAHLTADEVVAYVAARATGVNRSTVYRTLERFRDLGLISETDLGGGLRHFELLDVERHHHLVCQNCGALTEVDDALIAPLRQALRDRYGFVAAIDHLALFGQCARCGSREDVNPGG